MKVDSIEAILHKASIDEKVKILTDISDSFGRKNPDKFINFCTSISSDLSNSQKNEKSELFYLSALAYDYKNDYSNALQYYLKSAEIAKQIKNDKKLIIAYNKIGTIYDTFGKYDSAYEYTYKALNLSTALKDSEEIANSTHNLGVILDTEGKLNQALEKYRKALTIREKINDQPGIIKSYLSIGNICRLESKYDSAFTYFHKALKLSEKIQQKECLVNSIHYLGILYYKLKKYPTALEHFNESLVIWDDLNNLQKKAVTLGYLGLTYTKLNDYHTSLQKHEQAFSLRTKINDVAGIGNSLNNMAENYYFLGKYNKALSYSFKSLKLRQSIGGEYGVAECRRLIANTYIKMANYKKAIDFLNLSTEFAERENISDKLALNYFSLSEAYKLDGQFEKALDYFKLYSALNDSLLLKEYGQRVTELQIKYESEKREKEIEVLKNSQTSQNLELNKQKYRNDLLLVILFCGFIVTAAIYLRYRFVKKTKKILLEKNDEIDDQKNKLEKLNSTKDIFFSIIAHDLKNPFNMLINYSELLSSEFDNLTNKEKVDFINTIGQVSRKSYQLLENLLQWAKVQTGIIDWKMENLELKRIINECLQLLDYNSGLKNITLQSEFNGSTLIFSDQNLISTILRNLLTNAIKFTSNGGHVKVVTCEEKDFILITVEDNGIGMNKETMEKLFRIDVHQSSPGTSFEKGSGLGLILCKEFIEKSGGKIWVESSPGKGSKFTFGVKKALVEKDILKSSPEMQVL